jgi:uncharacterized protein YbjT (DUF2867 family)
MILLTGATGNIGKELVHDLTARKAAFKVMTRSKEAAKAFEAKGIQVAMGDYEHSGSYADALAGVDQVFLLTVPRPDLTRLEGEFLKTCKAKGVKHIVRLSALGANPYAASGLVRGHGRCEAQLEDSGLAWTLLRPSFFMQNLGNFMGPSIAKESTLYSCAGGAMVPWVDTRDIAAVAGTVLTTKGHEARIYEITGPEALSYADVADRLSAAMGRRIAYVNVPDGVAYQAMTDMGMTPWLTEGMITLYHLCRANGTTAVPLDTVERITGHAPRTLEAYIQENKAAFRSAATAKVTSH